MSGAAEMMPVAVYRGDRRIEVDQRPVPEPGRGEVLVEVSHCGICGSDLHMVLEGWGAPDKVPGHEWSGTVAAVGPDTTGVDVGDRVIGGPDEACGECRYCNANRPVLCVGRTPPTHGDGMGAFAKYVRTRGSRTHRVPDGMDLKVAALTEPLAVALHGITQSRAQAGMKVLVTGAGP